MDPLTQVFAQGCKTFIERMFEWGPFFILAVLMLYGLYRLVRGVGMKVVGALEKPTGALTMQAESMDKLTNSIQDYVGRDANEHQEIIILQKVIRRELMETRSDLTVMKAQSERIENRLKENPDGRS